MFGKSLTEPKTETKYKLITDVGDGFYSWNGNIFRSDIVRACIRPKARAIGKLVAQHIRSNESGFKSDPDNNIKMLLQEPNPLMSGQMMQEKLAIQLELNNNAFAMIKRNKETFIAEEIYPVPATQVDMLEGPYNDMYLKFYFTDGKQMIVPYVDVIHLRQDFNKHNLFGDSPQESLIDLMDVVTTVDQGMIKAIKNSNIIKWLLKFNQTLRPEDIKRETERFTEDFLKIDSNSAGAAAVDAKVDAQQVEPKDYVPNEHQMTNVTKRIYDFFNTNESIVQSKYTEDEWNSYYESVIEPVGLQLSNEFTRKLFSKRERGHGNKIIFESSNLQYASMSTKLGLERMVDRGAMTPNQWRKILNLGPIEGGDKPIRRLDTAEVKGGENDGQNGNKGTDNTEN